MTILGETVLFRRLVATRIRASLVSLVSLVNLVNPVMNPVMNPVVNLVGESIEFTVNHEWPNH